MNKLLYTNIEDLRPFHAKSIAKHLLLHLQPPLAATHLSFNLNLIHHPKVKHNDTAI